MSGIAISPQEKDVFKIVFAVRQLMEGRSNATGSVTLAAGATSTTVIAPTCAAGSAIFMFPQTVSAKTAVANSTDGPYVDPSNVTKGQFIITHSNLPSTDRTFWWVALG
jgi:hypothetical protein